MVRHRLAGITAGCLLSLAGFVHGEPVADHPSSDGRAPAPEVWGDPEETEEAQPGWTWFGMGYERRNRDSAATPLSGPGEVDGAPGKGQNGK